jgi:outer membrane protein TolC
MSMTKGLRSTCAVLATLTLAGCAGFSRDGGIDEVSTATQSRIGQKATWVKTEDDAKAARETVRNLVAQPLNADTAVQIALINNRGLQATYAELGIAEADVVQAGRLRNPGFSFKRKHRADIVEYERTFLFDILGLVTMPIRTDLEKRRFALTQQRVTAQTLQVAADTRRAWFNAVSAQQTAKYMEQVKLAAEASAELARRMAAAGNFSRLDQSREQLFYAEATAQLARTRQSALAAREHLTRLMGLWGEDIAYRLPERLPTLPQGTQAMNDIESRALKQRLDVQAAMKNAENIAASMGLVKVTGFVNVLEVGYLRNSESGEPRQTGYEIELRLPIFDWGDARIARAEYAYMQAVNHAADVAVKARSEVREAYAAYRTAFDVAQHYRDEIVPLRKRISEENLFRYNGMLISVFELLADARMQVAAVSAAIESLRDYWVADTSLQFTITAGSPGAMAVTGGSTAAMAAGAAAGGGH